MPVSVARRVISMECAVSLEPVPAITGMVTAPATARHSPTFSSSVRTELSPVEPLRTRPSLPCAASQRASSTAASRSSAPASSNGVTMAVITRPKRGVLHPCEGSINPSGYQRALRRSGDLAFRRRPVCERILVLGGVGQVLECDGAHFGELLTEPAVGRVEQTELLQVGHDLGEEQDLEVVALGSRLHDLHDVGDGDLHALPHLLHGHAVLHTDRGLEGELLPLAQLRCTELLVVLLQT